MEVVRSYFLAAVNAAQKTALNAHKVIFADFELGGEQGIILDETQLLQGLRALNKAILAELSTGIEGAFKLLTIDITGADPEYAQGDDLRWCKNSYTLAAEQRRFLQEKIGESLKKEETIEEEDGSGFVTVDHWDGRSNSEDYCQLAEEILWPRIKTNIFISVPHGDQKEPVADDNFYIYIWSAPLKSGSREVRTPPTIWGTEVACGDASFPASGLGLVIKDKTNNYAVAELVGENTLYIFHDLCHYGRESELTIFRKILEAVVAPEVFSQLKRFRRPAPVKKETKSKELESKKIDINKTLTMELPGFSSEECALARKVYAPIIARELMAKIKRGVCLHKNRSIRQQPLPFYDEVFHIFFTNSMAGRQFSSSNKLWGISLPAGNNPCPITREGVMVYDDAGQRVGQIIGGRNLYIPFFLFSDQKTLQRIFTCLMAEVARLFTSTAAERQQWEEEMRAAKGKAYAAICWQYKDLIKKDAAAEFVDITRQIKNFQTQLIAAIRKHDALKEATEGKRKGGDQEKFSADFEKMGRLEKIRQITFTPDCLIVETNTLFYSKKETRLIGAFQIFIPFWGNCEDIRFFNLTRRVNEFNAPNVAPDGQAYFGSQLQEILPQLIARFDFGPLITMCLIFLETAEGQASAGERVADWPIVTEQK
ncbi:MAG: hypothetical protein PHT40_02970 [Patescibacteria group bacterium]|nr:hypothetical protein [Patescibacteria group bacterium]